MKVFLFKDDRLCHGSCGFDLDTGVQDDRREKKKVKSKKQKHLRTVMRPSLIRVKAPISPSSHSHRTAARREANGLRNAMQCRSTCDGSSGRSCISQSSLSISIRHTTRGIKKIHHQHHPPASMMANMPPYACSK